jgi:hypothetical protein
MKDKTDCGAYCRSGQVDANVADGGIATWKETLKELTDRADNKADKKDEPEFSELARKRFREKQGKNQKETNMDAFFSYKME